MDRISARTRFIARLAGDRGRRLREREPRPATHLRPPMRGAPGATAARSARPRAPRCPRTAANTPGSVVMHGTPAVAVAVRMKYPSLRGPRPNGVLITRSTFPPRMSSATLCGPSDTFATRSTGMPARSSTPAVPLVATNRNPRSASRFAGNTIARLSRLATETNAVPLVGRPAPVETSAFASAMPGSRSIPMTSPGRLHLRARGRCRRRGTARTAGPRPSPPCTGGAGSDADRRATRPRPPGPPAAAP